MKKSYNILRKRLSLSGLLVGLSLFALPKAEAIVWGHPNPAWSGFTITKYINGQRQDASNYCGPASAQSMLTHDMGFSTPSQAALASAMHWGGTGVWPWYFASGLNKYTPKRKYSWADWSSWPYGELLYQYMKTRLGAKGESASILVSANLYGKGSQWEAHWITITGFSPSYLTHHTWQVWDSRENYGNYHHLTVRDWSSYFYLGTAPAVYPTD